MSTSERGGFDLRYHPAFFEDVDYALRVEHGGQVSRLVADRPVVHHHGMGGAGRGHGVAAVSQQTFRALWSERLARQPSRPSTDREAIRNRDRTCTRRIAFVADGSVVAERRVVGLREAVDLATSSPRDRVTFITGEADGLDVVAARNAGVEVITGDVERALADRSPHLTEVHDIADDGRRRWRAVVVAGVVVAVALAGVVARWLILRSSLGALNADEAYTGVQAFEILDGHLPIVIGGTVYTAVVESYVYAPIAALFGAHILHLKLVAVDVLGDRCARGAGDRVGARRPSGGRHRRRARLDHARGVAHGVDQRLRELRIRHGHDGCGVLPQPASV